jgi:hypothetical protein
LKWKKLKSNGDVPTPRSGHSFTHVGSVNYILYGGIDNSKKAGSKIMPNNDIFLMKVSSSKSRFKFKDMKHPVKGAVSLL